MTCEYFGVCGSCNFHHLLYEEQLKHKQHKMAELFAIDPATITTVASQPSHFRNRAEFRIFHTDEGASYAMHTVKHSLLPIQSCQIVSPKIASTMPALLALVNADKELSHKLYAIEFLSAFGTDEMLITLIYHHRVGDELFEKCQQIGAQNAWSIVLRSKKQKRVVHKDYILDKLLIFDKPYFYYHQETSFVQPNAGVNEKMIEFAKKNTVNLGGDLLELYCGNGNFTIALSENFRQVLTTEVSKSSMISLRKNIQKNNISNIEFARMSAEEIITALKKQREFTRLRNIDLDAYQFSCVLIDPPRSGLDDETRDFITTFQTIIYISCNPQSLHHDLQTLSQTHSISKHTLFDQFAYTEHTEMGVVLTKIA